MQTVATHVIRTTYALQLLSVSCCSCCLQSDLKKVGAAAQEVGAAQEEAAALKKDLKAAQTTLEDKSKALEQSEQALKEVQVSDPHGTSPQENDQHCPDAFRHKPGCAAAAHVQTPPGLRPGPITYSPMLYREFTAVFTVNCTTLIKLWTLDWCCI